MTVENFGLVAWEEVEFIRGGNDSNRTRDEFIRLQNGSNVVRLITKPYQYIVHKWKEPNDKGYGDKVLCSMFNGSCPLCEKGDKPRQRWYIGLIDRKTQSYKLLDMSSAIFQAIQKLNRNESWGDPGAYDVDIVVDKNAGANGYYTVMPMPKSPLSDRDVEAKTGVDHDALKKRCKPPQLDEVVRRLGFLRKDKTAAAAEESQHAPVQAHQGAAAAQAVAPGEYDFPAAGV